MELFSITNALGETYDLHNRYGKIFLFEPKGLGFEEGTDYERIGNTYVVTEQYFEQHKITGEVIFSSDDFYEQYYNFVNFCQHAPLTLNYRSHDDFHMKARLNKIEKGDKSNNHMLVCEVEFKALSLWYRTKTGVIIGADDTEHDVYPFTYGDYTYPKEVRQSVNIDVDSSQDSPVMIRIKGPAENPAWRHYVDGVLIGTGKYTGVIDSGRVLCIDNTSVPYSVSETTEAGRLIGDRYQLCDFGTDRFFYAREGRNTFSVSHDGVSGLDATVEVRIYYASV